MPTFKVRYCACNRPFFGENGACDTFPEGREIFHNPTIAWHPDSRPEFRADMSLTSQIHRAPITMPQHPRLTQTKAPGRKPSEKRGEGVVGKSSISAVAKTREKIEPSGGETIVRLRNRQPHPEATKLAPIQMSACLASIKNSGLPFCHCLRCPIMHKIHFFHFFHSKLD